MCAMMQAETAAYGQRPSEMEVDPMKNQKLLAHTDHML